jgi:hypothetical protein
MTVGYTLGPNEGEHLVLRGGSIFIKADPSRGSDGITMVTQQVLATRWPITMRWNFPTGSWY